MPLRSTLHFLLLSINLLFLLLSPGRAQPNPTFESFSNLQSQNHNYLSTNLLTLTNGQANGQGPGPEMSPHPYLQYQYHPKTEEDDDDNNLLENVIQKIPQEPELAKVEADPEYEDEADSTEERDCPTGFWWHIRGQRCVPTRCIGGNKFRHPKTGECVRKSRRKFNKGPIVFFSRGSSHRRFLPVRNFGWGRVVRG